MQKREVLFILAAALLWSAPLSANADPGADCSTLRPPPEISHALKRRLALQDLVELRDIGSAADQGSTGPSAIAISPDGSHLAFQIRQAKARANAYCLGMFVLDPSGKLSQVDAGGDLVHASAANWDIADFPNGSPTLITPHWSADAKTVAFLRRDHDVTQVWLANLGATKASQITSSSSDVEDFAFTDDGSGLVYSTSASEAMDRSNLAAEAKAGFHFDDRFVPRVSSEPLSLLPNVPAYHYVDLRTGETSEASGQQAALLANGDEPTGAILSSTAPDGSKAWVTKAAEGPGTVLHAAQAGGQELVCEGDACTASIAGLWWSPDRKEIWFQVREGWANSWTAFYRWSPVAGAKASKVYATQDVLSSCVVNDGGLVCLDEGSTQPRRIVALDMRAGRVKVLFDPNPEFKEIALGSVRRLEWTNAMGLECIGDLVLPPDRIAGQKYPLIIVQYVTKGFLRGGTGDEYPIQAFANQGFAVLSFQRPKDYAPPVKDDSTADFDRRETIGWADRRSVDSALSIGISRAIATGDVDGNHVGLTGMSDGASTAQFALINSNLYQAAVLSTCCIDETTFLMTGQATARAFEGMGYPKLTDPAPDFWKPYSLAANASRLKTPLLLNLSDDEYLMALGTVKAFSEQGVPVDMYVFPREHHVKWQPAHRLAIYQRNIDWFNFWLKGQTPADTAEYKRWQTLKCRSAEPPKGSGMACD